ncbi:MAG: cyclic nucleotide-binding domain-containing protein, partial [Candidatus Omnitrophica bacterium]|nr:cyclic nucleotide-binding domain-containing protein [Candidatus Omnitrophota bacterium]
MKTFKKELILKEIPLFVGLSTKELILIKESSSLVEYRKGQVIYKEGTNPSAFYCIVFGRVVISALDFQGKETILEYLHRGKYFGIISLLTGEPHSVSAKAINDCLLLVINKEEFDFLLKKISSLAIDLSRTLSRRLKRKDIHAKKIFESTIISVFSSYPRAGKTIYAANLGFGLKKETHKSVVILDICPKIKTHSMPRRLGMESGYKVFDLSNKAADMNKVKEFIFKDRFDIDIIFFNYRPKDKSYVRMLLGILSSLVNDYHYIVLDLPSYMDDSIFGILNQSDIIHLLTSPDLADLKRTRRLIQKMKNYFFFSPSKIKVIINEYKSGRLSYPEEMKLLGSNIFAVLPRIEYKEPARLFLDKPACEYAKTIRRISRQEGDCMVGLALGIGVAYGFCHIGVLKVIEEEKIPIDVITGSSMG